MELKQSGKTALLALVVLLGTLLQGQDLKSLQPQGYVSDFAGVLDPSARAQLEDYCTRVQQATGVQIALVTVKTLNDAPIEDAGNDLFHRWGIGQKGKDEGLLLLLAVQDHKDRIEVGYGLEPILPDGFVGSILRTIKPYLQQNNYSEAMLAAAQEMGSRIAQAKGVSLDFSLQRRPVRTSRPHSGIPWTLVIIGLVLLFSFFGRGGRSGGGGGVGGFLPGMLLGSLMGRSGGGGGGGGGFGGYDSGGGGGGGFGGFGGGDSGGGGASGNW